MPNNLPYNSAQNGVVLSAEKINGQWNVVIQYDDGGFQAFSLLDEAYVMPCQRVGVGDLIGIRYGTVGSISSIGLTMPSQFTVDNSPLTDNGVITVTWNDIPDKYYLGAPNGGGQPVFRQISYNDLTDTPGSAWLLNGNAGTTYANFIGTTSNAPLTFKVHNVLSGFITESGWNIFPIVPHGSVTIMGSHAGETLIPMVNAGTYDGGGNTLYGSNAGMFIGATFDSGVLRGSDENVFIGNWAGMFTQHVDEYDDQKGRNVGIGESALFNNISGSRNTAIGTFSMEVSNKGKVNTAVGADSLRSVTDGDYNTAMGAFSLLYNSTGIGSITVTNGGSGYTNATVTISAPYHYGSPGACNNTATATATISGGVITGITITDPGCGYSDRGGTKYTGYPQPPITVTITGDGTGATATATVKSGNLNSALGLFAGYNHRMGTSNVFIGDHVGYIRRHFDSYLTLLGSYADVDASVPLSTNLQKSVAIGYGAKLTASNQMLLGGVGTDSVNVGINTNSPQYLLDVVSGDIRVHDIRIGRGVGSVSTNVVVGTDAMSTSGGNGQNVAIGYQSLKTMNAGQSGNVSIGYQALKDVIYSYQNTAIGFKAMSTMPSGYGAYNGVAIGAFAAYSGGNVRGVAVGSLALYNATTGQASDTDGTVAIGDRALFATTSGINNTAVGAGAGYNITTGTANTALGLAALGSGWLGVGGATAVTGSYNTAIGVGTILYNKTSSNNTALGYQALGGSGFAPTTGFNVGLGYNSGSAITTGNYNVILGSNDGSTIAALNNQILLSDGQGNRRATFNSTYSSLKGILKLEDVPNAYSTGSYDVLVRNQSTGEVETTTITGGGSFTLTDGNGTTANGTAVDLGGMLLHDTTVETDGYQMIFGLGNTGNDFISFVGNSGVDPYIAAYLQSADATKYINFQLYNDGLFFDQHYGTHHNIIQTSNNTVELRATDSSGLANILLRYDGAINLTTTGNYLSLLSYGSGTKTGTATYGLAVDSVGKVIEVALGSGGSLPSLAQYHMYVGDASNVPVDGGAGITWDGTTLLINNVGAGSGSNITTKGDFRLGTTTGASLFFNSYSYGAGDYIKNPTGGQLDFNLAGANTLSLTNTSVILPVVPATYSTGGVQLLLRNSGSGNIEKIPAITDKQVMFSNSGLPAGDTAMTWDSANNRLYVGFTSNQNDNSLQVDGSIYGHRNSINTAGTSALAAVSEYTMNGTSLTAGAGIMAGYNAMTLAITGNTTIAASDVWSSQLNQLILGSSTSSTVTVSTMSGNRRAISANNTQVIFAAMGAGVTTTIDDVCSYRIQAPLQVGLTNWVHVTNYTGLFIENQAQQIANGTYITSMYAIYQEGTGDRNLFAAQKNTFGSQNAPTSALDVTGAHGYDQLRLRSSYTPTSSADTNGNVGDVCWDGTNLYWKTGGGWLKAVGATF